MTSNFQKIGRAVNVRTLSYVIFFLFMFYVCSATQSETDRCAPSAPLLFCYSKLKLKKKKKENPEKVIRMKIIKRKLMNTL